MLEARLARIPSQNLACLLWIAKQLLHFCRSEILRIDLYQHTSGLLVDALLVETIALPLQFDAHKAERQCSELAHGVILAGSNHEVVGFGLLQDKPHTLHVVGCIAPVAQCIEVAKIELILMSRGYAACSKGYLSGNESFAAALALVVEQYAVAAVHAIALAVVLHYPVAIELCHGVGRARIERSCLLLRHFLYLAEEL